MAKLTSIKRSFNDESAVELAGYVVETQNLLVIDVTVEDWIKIGKTFPLSAFMRQFDVNVASGFVHALLYTNHSKPQALDDEPIEGENPIN